MPSENEAQVTEVTEIDFRFSERSGVCFGTTKMVSHLASFVVAIAVKWFCLQFSWTGLPILLCHQVFSEHSSV